MLDIIQKHPEDGLAVFIKSKYASAAEISKFFVPSFSSEEEKLALEEVVVYNFMKFLKKVESKYGNGPCLLFKLNVTILNAFLHGKKLCNSSLILN